MPRIGAALALLLVVVAGPALAGAWPREPGGVFLSFRLEDDGDASLYGEYGLTRRITLGGQLSTDERHEPPDRLDLPPPRDGRAGAFARLAVGSVEATHRFAVSLGVSAPPDTVGMATRPRLEAGLHWGRGFESALGGGWATATARLLRDPGQDRPITDLSALVGLRPAPRTMAMLAVSRWRDEVGTYWKVAPSAGYELGTNLWIVPQVTSEFGDATETRASLSFWLSF
jgi:hypothetical protein